MGPRDITELVSLAMLWSGSFLFVRVGAAEFGPVVLSALRLVGASLLLLPLLLWRGQWTVDSAAPTLAAHLLCWRHQLFPALRVFRLRRLVDQRGLDGHLQRRHALVLRRHCVVVVERPPYFTAHRRFGDWFHRCGVVGLARFR